MIAQLLTAPVSLPLSGLRFILETLRECAERELMDEGHIREELLLLQLRLDEGALSEEAYAEEEAVIMARLRAARAFRQVAVVSESDGPARAWVERPNPSEWFDNFDNKKADGQA